MKIERTKTEGYILDEQEKAKFRTEILGTHKAPTKAKAVDKPKGKSGRMKTFYFNKELPSFGQFLRKEITFEQLRELQKAGQ